MTTKFEAQIAVLKNLHPRSAAWLADVPAATLRDNAHKLTPSESGTYDAREVAGWAQNRAVNNAITGDDAESVFLIGEQLAWNSDSQIDAIARLIRNLRQRHNENAVNSAVVAAILEHAETIGQYPTANPPTESEIAARIREAVEQELSWQDTRNLNIGVRCPQCKRTRQARDWKRGIPAAGRRMVELDCPGCEDHA